MNQAMRVVIGFDGSPASDVIVADLKNAGLPKRLEAIVLTAVEPAFPGCLEFPTHTPIAKLGPVEDLNKAVLDKASAIAGEAANRLRDAFPLWQVRTETSVQSPAWALTDLAAEWRAHLIVVGANGHSRLGRFLGSVSQLVLTHAPCSVRVSRKPPVKLALETRIVVGVDGSPASEKALRVVEAREWEGPVRVHVLSTLHADLALPLTGLVPATLRVPSPDVAPRRIVSDIVESFARDVSRDGRSAEGYVHEGDPKRILISEARQWDADCIFIGARGLSAVRRLVLGSVSMAVAARAGCSVEVVR